MQFVPGQLVLKSGEKYSGRVPASQQDIFFGEVVFNTGMVGYVETLTDPSYAGQILVFTYPLIGNYGVPDQSFWESQQIHAKGVVLATLPEFYAHHMAKIGLLEWLQQQKIPVIIDVDTRALTKRLRNTGVAVGAIIPATAKTPTDFPDFESIDWVSQVTLSKPITYGSGDKTIIAVDCGMKENILRCLLELPIKIKRVPYDYDYSNEKYDGIFLSNGPGDPTKCVKTVDILKKALNYKKPVFGICLGTQLMALAINAKTYKLPFGHRSQNQPCLDLKTNLAYLTSQNHGYAIDEKTLPADWRVSFRNLNDQTVAGIEHQKLPFFSVQFHPEAAPGPLDTQWLFKKFYEYL